MAVTLLKTSQQLLSSLFADEASALVWSTDRELRVTHVAGGVLAILGEPDLELGTVVDHFFEQTDDGDRSLVTAHHAALQGARDSCHFDWRGWHFRGSVLPLTDEQGSEIGCLGYASLHATIDGLEEALDASERRFETLVGMSPAGIYMTDEQGRCTYVNQRCCEMAGLPAVDALGQPWEHMVHPEDRPRVVSRWQAAKKTGGVWEHTYRLLSPQGELTWVLTQVRPLHDGSERNTGYVGIIIDITKRKRADRRLRESERRFSRLLSAVTSYRYSVRLKEGMVVETEHTTGCEATTGYSPEDYDRDPFLWINMIHPEDRDMVRDQVSRIMDGHSVPPLEHRIFHKNGTVVWVRNTIIPHFTPADQLARYDGLIEDITDRKRMERRLWQILESAPDAMVITDERGTILLANGQTQRLFGYASSELIGQAVETLIPERFRASHLAHRRGYHNSPELRVMTKRPELCGLRKDGSEFAAEISLSPIEMDDGVLVCAGIRDVTHRKEVEQALRSNLQIQSTLASLLKLSMERIDLQEMMARSLDLLFTIPWISLESRGAIFLTRNGGESLELVAQRGLSPAQLEVCGKIKVGHCLCGLAAESRQTVYADRASACLDVQSVDPLQCEDRGAHGHYCVPITTSDAVLGVINLHLSPGHVRSDDEERFLEAVAHVLAGIITRSRAEESLRSSEERFDLAVRGTDAGIWDWNLQTDEVYFSPRWKGMLGFAPDELGDDFSTWKARIHPDDRERAQATVEAYLNGESDHYELEHRLQHRDGTYRWILARGALVRGPDGQPHRIVGSHLDITDRKLAQDQLRYREAQLIAAQRIQQYLLPRSAPTVPGYDIAGCVIPAQFAGGDCFDYLILPDATLAIVVGDVSGHDISAALVMASTSAHLRSFAEDHSCVQGIVEHTNAILARETDEGRFVTLFVLQLEAARRTFRYLNAGHPHAYHLDGHGNLKAKLGSTSLPLAVLADTEFPISDPVPLQSGDLVLIITDGILESRGPDGTYFEPDDLLDVVRRHHQEPATAIIDAVQRAVLQHSGESQARDDLTIVVLKVE